MHVYRIAAVLCVSGLLAACGGYTPGGPTFRYTPPAPVPQEPMHAFDAAALQAGMQPGHAIVRGQAFSKTVGGDVKYGAGNTIAIVPATDYAKECTGLMIYGTSSCGTQIAPYTRTVMADGEGRFEVDDLAPGSYLLSTQITWGVPGPYGIQTTGGVVLNVVEVKADTDVLTVNLTDHM